MCNGSTGRRRSMCGSISCPIANTSTSASTSTSLRAAFSRLSPIFQPAHRATSPDRHPTKLSIIGSGALDDFNAKLAFDAGQGVGATGDASLNREGAGRRLGLDLAAEGSGLLPQIAAPVFAGTTRLSGNVFFGDDRAIVIPGVELTAAAARLDVTGGLSAAQIVDIRISAKNVPNAARLSRMPRSGAWPLMPMSQAP